MTTGPAPQDLGRRPRVLISYAHADPEHERSVTEFWHFLERNGVDVIIDQQVADHPQDWASWTGSQIREADFVLVVASQAYKLRDRLGGAVTAGRGARWEANLIRDQFYADPERARARILPVLLPGANEDDFPEWLNPYSCTTYRVSSFSREGAVPLLRYLTGQPQPATSTASRDRASASSGRQSRTQTGSASRDPQSGLPLSAAGPSSRSPLILALLAVTVVSVVFALAVLPRLRDNKGTPSGNAALSTVAAPLNPSTMETSPTTPTAGALSVGACLKGSTTVDCRDEHDKEVFATNQRGCSRGELISYLGGDPAVDVLSPSITIAPAGDVCLATFGTGAVTEPQADALLSSRGEGLRYCLDGRRGFAAVSCSAEHTAEVTKLSTTSLSPQECEAASAAYVGITPAELREGLEPQPAHIGKNRGCIVSVRGDNLLTGTVRALKTKPLPLQVHRADQ